MITLRANDPSAADIDEIWSFEAVQHGDSALVNKGNLCGLCKPHGGHLTAFHQC